jgi:hypothetical protein
MVFITDTHEFDETSSHLIVVLLFMEHSTHLSHGSNYSKHLVMNPMLLDHLDLDDITVFSNNEITAGEGICDPIFHSGSRQALPRFKLDCVSLIRLRQQYGGEEDDDQHSDEEAVVSKRTIQSKPPFSEDGIAF